MTWAHNTKEKLDEVALTSCRHTKSWIRRKAHGDPRYASSLRRQVLVLMYELWPPAGGAPASQYHAMVSSDLESMPFDLLDTLSDKLARHARRVRDEDPAASAAAYLIGGWMRCKCLELQGEHMVRFPTKKLKSEHEQFLRDLLCEPDLSPPDTRNIGVRVPDLLPIAEVHR